MNTTSVINFLRTAEDNDHNLSENAYSIWRYMQWAEHKFCGGTIFLKRDECLSKVIGVLDAHQPEERMNRQRCKCVT
jgi:hypothetical protein